MFRSVHTGVLLLALSGGQAAAAEPANPASPAAPEASAGESASLPETTRQSVRSATEWVARVVDGWFGDKPFEEGGKVSNGRLDIGLFKRQDQSLDLDVRLKADFRLPNVERSAYFFIGRDDQREAIRDSPDELQRQQQLLAIRPVERSFLGGLGVSFRDLIDFRLGVGAGLQPYLQARFDLPWVIGPGQRMDFRETVFWTHEDRLGATSVLSYQLELTRTLALKWQIAGTVTQEQRPLDWSGSLGAYRSFGGQRLLSLEALISGTGHGTPGVSSSDRGLLLKWQQPVYKDWLLAEFVGGHFWARPDEARAREQAWALGASLKLRF